jgi:hypothetical protein
MPPATADEHSPLVALRGVGKSFPNGVRASVMAPTPSVKASPESTIPYSFILATE